MDLSNLKPAKGSIKKRKRIARGQGSGKGGTATRGHKGAQSRSGYRRRAGFEGGQMPLQRRVPKRGFKNLNRIEYQVLNLNRLQALADSHKCKSFDIDTFIRIGLISGKEKIKILGQGELKDNLEVTANAFSETAKKAIEDKGGKTSIV